MEKTVVLSLAVIFLSLPIIFQNPEISEPAAPETTPVAVIPITIQGPTPTPPLPVLPTAKILNNNYHTFQTFNNCGPASLSMALSYFDINVSQGVLGNSMRPYQNSAGDNDDKSVTLAEVAKEAEKYGLVAFHRPNGDIEKVKHFINMDLPVVTRTWTKVNEDIGHFRVIKGYDENTKEIVQDDSLQGKNLRYSYSEFGTLWEKFNFEYLVLAPKEKEADVIKILGDEADMNVSRQKAVLNIKERLAQNPNDIYQTFNLAIAYYQVGRYNEAINEYEKVENALPFRTLWYQIEPILAYYEAGNYDKVFAITDKVLENGNRAYSEAYVVRGRSYQKMGMTDLANDEFDKARFYNRNLMF